MWKAMSRVLFIRDARLDCVIQDIPCYVGHLPSPAERKDTGKRAKPEEYWILILVLMFIFCSDLSCHSPLLTPSLRWISYVFCTF